jgi:hypothetical protein
MSEVKVTNEGLRSHLTRAAFQDVLSLVRQLAPAPAPRPATNAAVGGDAGHVIASAAQQRRELHLWDEVQEDVFRR